jgi:hypothetical protein
MVSGKDDADAMPGLAQQLPMRRSVCRTRWIFEKFLCQSMCLLRAFFNWGVID